MDFACKAIDVRDVLKCSFGLTKADLQVFATLNAANTALSSAAVESRTHLDRSTVQRSLKRLTEKELCIRQQKNNPEGGYTFYYKQIPATVLAGRVMTILDGFRQRLEKSLHHNEWTRT